MADAPPEHIAQNKENDLSCVAPAAVVDGIVGAVISPVGFVLLGLELVTGNFAGVPLSHA